jgi:acyl transferase domain-containing protein
VIRGSSENHGGHARSLTSPNTNAQAEVITDAHERANIDPDTVSYIEAHGTGTKIGDPVEINGLKKAFNKLYENSNKLLPEESYCGLGSVKSNIGHLEATSGMAGLIKVLLAMQHEKIPATINFKQLNSYIELDDSPFYIVDEIQEWNCLNNEDDSLIPRRAGVSSFGYGGTNVHLVLEEYQEKTNKDFYQEQEHLFVLSAKTKDRLISYAKKMVDFLESAFPSKFDNSETEEKTDSSITLEEIIYTLQVGREAMETRLAIIVTSIEELEKKLRRFIQGKDEIESFYQSDKDDLQDREVTEQQVSKFIKNRELNKVAELYVLGIEIDWELLYQKKEINRVSLPTYPFKKESYWFDSSHGENQLTLKTPSEITENDKQENGTGGKLNLNSKEETSKEEGKISNQAQGPSNASPSLINYLKEVLAEVLHTDSSQIDRDKPFVDLGLDSILSLEFVKKLNGEFELDIKVSRLYDYPTLNELAEHLERLGVTNKLEKESLENTNEKESQIDLNPKQEGEENTEQAQVTSQFDNNVVIDGNKDKSAKDIAIIGVSARLPDSKDISSFWNNLKNGEDLITEVPLGRWDADEYYVPDSYTPNKSYSKWGGFLEDIDKFDPLFFNISPAEAKRLDPRQRLFLEEAWKSLEDAGYSEKRLDNTSCGVYAGVMSEWNNYSSELANGHSVLAARIAYFLNLKGPAISIDTACSSSMVAVHLACQSLLTGETEMMLAGGVSLYLDEEPYIKMSKAGMLSPEGRCKTFDNDADGFVPGEGVGVLVLKRLDKAIEDDDYIYGTIKSSAINQDGKTNGITAPSVKSQIELEREVYEKADINPETISYIECHGTGTKLGDPIEIEALTEVFREYTNKKQYCPVGSVKTNIGHSSAVLLGLKHEQIPPSINFQEPNEQIDFANSPFYVNTELKNWDKDETSPRRAAVSSFGYSGTNSHLVIEEGPDLKRKKEFEQTWPPAYLITFSAKKDDALQEKLEDMIDYLEKKNVLLGDIAYTLSLGRSHFSYRSAVIVEDITDLKQKLRLVCDNKEDEMENYFTGKKEKNIACDEPALKELTKSVVNKLHDSTNLSEKEYWDKLRVLGDLYVKGFDPDWAVLFQEGDYRRIPLPKYPFSRESYWVSEMSESEEG